MHSNSKIIGHRFYDCTKSQRLRSRLKKEMSHFTSRFTQPTKGPICCSNPAAKNHPNTTTTISTFADLLITYRSGLYFTVVDTRSVNSKCRTGKLPPLGNFSVLVTAGRRLCTRRLESIVFLSLAHMPHKRCKISVPMKNWSCSVVHSADINIAIIKNIIWKAHAVGQR